MQTKDPIKYAYHKQQRSDKQGTQPNKSTAHKITKMRLTNLHQP